MYYTNWLLAGLLFELVPILSAFLIVIFFSVSRSGVVVAAFLFLFLQVKGAIDYSNQGVSRRRHIVAASMEKRNLVHI